MIRNFAVLEGQQRGFALYPNLEVPITSVMVFFLHEQLIKKQRGKMRKLLRLSEQASGIVYCNIVFKSWSSMWRFYLNLFLNDSTLRISVASIFIYRWINCYKINLLYFKG